MDLARRLVVVSDGRCVAAFQPAARRTVRTVLGGCALGRRMRERGAVGVGAACSLTGLRRGGCRAA